MYRIGGEVLAPAVLGTTVARTGTLAATGFAFGLYLAVAFSLIVVGIALRWAAATRERTA